MNEKSDKLDKLDRIMDFIDESKKTKGFDRVLTWMENHPILAVLILWVFISKVTKNLNHHDKE